MKTLKTGLIISLFLATLSLGPVRAAEDGLLDGNLSTSGIEVSGELAFNSIYMWRGIMLDGDAVVQPGFYVRSPESKFGRVKLGVWFNHDLQNQDSLRSSETDYIFDYTYSFPSLDLSTGFTYYDFPDAVPPDGSSGGFSREAYGGITFNKLLLSPAIYYYYDFGRKEDGGGQGSYTVLNLSHSIPFVVSKYNLSLDLSGHVGYNNKQYYRGKGGDAALGAGVTVPLLKNLTCKPNINYSVPWGNISDKNNGNQKNRLYGGVYMSYIF
ncbi:MAG: hypothetical protein COV71_00485 [Candidatus Omnitrophica bacterium CG11_big_fil_rev_8_21_14_0_20_41_12]|nr:MAG: hypothetical protein COV71_00485 [Candidatus Omnitrophica bacterium CG11_big_fil_rev_8_21_14_0_20_41_12]